MRLTVLSLSTLLLACGSPPSPSPEVAATTISISEPSSTAPCTNARASSP